MSRPRDPATTARADQLRASIRDALTRRCTCGDCPTDVELMLALTMDDASLVDLIDGP